MDKGWEGWRDRRMSGGMEMSLRMHEVSGESLWFPVLPTGGVPSSSACSPTQHCDTIPPVISLS